MTKRIREFFDLSEADDEERPPQLNGDDDDLLLGGPAAPESDPFLGPGELGDAAQDEFGSDFVDYGEYGGQDAQPTAQPMDTQDDFGVEPEDMWNMLSTPDYEPVVDQGERMSRGFDEFYTTAVDYMGGDHDFPDEEFVADARKAWKAGESPQTFAFRYSGSGLPTEDEAEEMLDSEPATPFGSMDTFAVDDTLQDTMDDFSEPEIYPGNNPNRETMVGSTGFNDDSMTKDAQQDPRRLPVKEHFGLAEAEKGQGWAMDWEDQLPDSSKKISLKYPNAGQDPNEKWHADRFKDDTGYVDAGVYSVGSAEEGQYSWEDFQQALPDVAEEFEAEFGAPEAGGIFSVDPQKGSVEYYSPNEEIFRFLGNVAGWYGPLEGDDVLSPPSYSETGEYEPGEMELARSAKIDAMPDLWAKEPVQDQIPAGETPAPAAEETPPATYTGGDADFEDIMKRLGYDK